MTQISAADIVWLASAPNAASGYSSAQVTVPEGSLGRYCSQNVINSAVADNLFSDISGNENAAGQVDYQCVFVLNNTGTGNTMMSPVIWMPTAQYSPESCSIQFTVDQTAPSVKTSNSAQALAISSSLIAPAVTGSWVTPSATVSGGLSCPAIAPGYVQAVWVKRTAANTGGGSSAFGLQITFDTYG